MKSNHSNVVEKQTGATAAEVKPALCPLKSVAGGDVGGQA